MNAKCKRSCFIHWSYTSNLWYNNDASCMSIIQYVRKRQWTSLLLRWLMSGRYLNEGQDLGCCYLAHSPAPYSLFRVNFDGPASVTVLSGGRLQADRRGNCSRLIKHRPSSIDKQSIITRRLTTRKHYLHRIFRLIHLLWTYYIDRRTESFNKLHAKIGSTHFYLNPLISFTEVRILTSIRGTV